MHALKRSASFGFINDCRRLASLFSALSTNNSLTKLEVDAYLIGGVEAGSALAHALHSNKVLRELVLLETSPEGCYGAEGPAAEGLALILGALGGEVGVGEAPAAGASVGAPGSRDGCCAFSSLRLRSMQVIDAACAAALGASLRNGAPLTAFSMFPQSDDCEDSIDGAAVAAEIGKTLVALGPAGVLRELELDQILIHDAGAHRGQTE